MALEITIIKERLGSFAKLTRKKNLNFNQDIPVVISSNTSGSHMTVWEILVNQTLFSITPVNILGKH